MTTTASPIVIGTRISCILHWAGRGIVFAIEGEQRPETVRVAGGVIHSGGSASFNVVFDNGRISKAVPEAIIRGVQWRVLDETATADDIAEALARAACAKATASVAASNAKARFAEAIAQLRADPAYSALVQSDDQYSDKIATKNIRAELKANFKGVKFSVRNRDHGSVDISWTDGPTVATVEGIVNKYQRGNFNGMEDIYESDPSAWNHVFGGAKYVFTQRDFSADLITKAIEAVFVEFSGNLDETPKPSAEDYLQGRLYSSRIPGLGGPFDQMDVAVRAQASKMEA